MPFVAEILKHRSLSIVGLEKNTGKTVCLNYVLRRLADMGVRCAVTSIGVDGEQVDAVYGSAKPEVRLYEGMYFTTSEQHYHRRRVVSDIVAVDPARTALGRLVTARVVCGGKALISGAASTPMMQQYMSLYDSLGCRLSIVDGALSRLSPASPTVTEAMILATGAAVSANLAQLIARTRFAYRLISLPEVDEGLRRALSPIAQGLWGVDSDGVPHDLQVASAFLLERSEADLTRFGTTLFAAGAVTDRLLRHLAAHRRVADITLVARDFTKLFASADTVGAFAQRGGQLRVLNRSSLVAICLNPTSPRGYHLHSADACRALSDALGIPVYDVKQCTPPAL